jgi:hypothetical protein
MKMKNKILMTTGFAATLALSACSVKTSSDTSAPGIVKPAAINGPSLEGQWISDCLINPIAMDGYRMLRLKISGTNFEHEEQDFSDSNCAQRIDGKTLKGTFSYTKDLGLGVFQVEYRIPVDANVSALRDQRISLQGDDLKVSEWLSGFDDEDKGVVPTIALHKVRSATLAPTTPAPAPRPQGLQSGYYQPDSGDYCSASISIAAMNGQTAAVYVDFQSPCTASLEFDCSGSTCTMSGSDSMSVTLVDANSFRLNILSKDQQVTYRRR